jgi:hypothetical protein
MQGIGEGAFPLMPPKMAHRVEDQFARAFEQAHGRLLARLESACACQLEWPQKVAAAIRAGFEFIAERPDEARLLTVEALAAGEEARHEQMVCGFATLLLRGRALCPGAADLPSIHESATAGAVVSLARLHLMRGSADEMPLLAPDAIEFVLSPYLGVGDARLLAARHRPTRRGM